MSKLNEIMGRKNNELKGNDFLAENGVIALKDRHDPVIPYLEAVQKILVFNNYDNKPYLNSNVSWPGFDQFDLSKVNKAFTILSSGETVIQLLKNDILDIKAVDNNPLQKPVFALRKAAFKTLSPNEFESFMLYPDGYQYLSKDIYNYIKDAFDEDEDTEKRFWEYILSSTDEVDRRVMFKGGIENIEIDKVRANLSYLKKKKDYYKIRENLEKANISIEINDALDSLEKDEKYDYIDISNILIFYNQLLKSKDMRKIYDRLRKIYENNLNDNEIFILDYLYSFDVSSIIEEQDDDTKKLFIKMYMEVYKNLQELFELDTIHPNSIPGTTPLEGDKDTIVYTKK